jgi:WD40 repeat protein
LQTFRQEDAQDFFGRDRLIDELVEKVRQMLVTHPSSEVVSRLLTVVGASGSGKSSVVMAGLLPNLQRGVLPGSQFWKYLVPIVPGQHPIEALTLTLSSLFPERSLKSIQEDLEDDSARGLHLLLAESVQETRTRVVLLIDQFEELFTQTSTEEERRRFLDLLLAAVTEPAGSLLAVLTLRADFYDRPLQYPELGRLIEIQHVTAYPLETQDLRAVIKRPAQLPDVQLAFEEDLVGDLLFEVQGQAGALPLLQFTLDQLFHQRQGRLLTRRAYHEIGGVQGALAKHAEHTYQSLPTRHHQQLARALFLRLVNPGTMEQDATKLRVLLNQLVVSDPEETTRLEMVTSTFIGARLLTANTIGGVPTIEVSHEALLRAWTRLRDWFHEARDDIRLQQTINKDAVEWQRHEQPTDRLYRGTQLTEALQWRSINLPNRDEESFLQASIKEHQRLERQRRQVLTRRLVLIGGTGILGITGMVFFVRSFLGNSTSPAPITLYRNHSQPMLKVSWSPIATSHLLASAGRDRTIHVWNVLTGTDSNTPYGNHTDAIFSLAWSPDGTRIAAGSNDKTVLVYDLATGQTITEYKEHSANVSGVARSPDGQTIASVGDKTENGIHFWNANTGEDLFPPLRKDSYQIYVLSWSHNGQFIAAGGQGKSVLVWDVPNRTFAFSLPNDGEVYALAWSYDDRYLVAGGGDGTVKVWDIAGQKMLLTYREHRAAIHGLSWSPDGHRIVSSAYDRTVRVWDRTGKTIQVYFGPDWGSQNTQKGKSVDWSPDGAYIAAAFSDTSIVPVWQAP